MRHDFFHDLSYFSQINIYLNCYEFDHKKIRTKLRIGAHNLLIENGKHLKTNPRERLYG